MGDGVKHAPPFDSVDQVPIVAIGAGAVVTIQRKRHARTCKYPGIGRPGYLLLLAENNNGIVTTAPDIGTDLHRGIAAG